MKDHQLRPSGMQTYSSDLAMWKELIYTRTGLYFSDSRLSGLDKSLKERMLDCKVSTYQEYYNFIISNSAIVSEWQKLLDLLLNNESDFFRHQPSFNALSNYVFPELIGHRNSDRQIKMWSAGCSMGQEAYSLIFSYLDFLSVHLNINLSQLFKEYLPKIKIKVIGSDISQKAIKKAKSGKYKSHEIRSLPEAYRDLYFTVVENKQYITYQVNSEILNFIDFGYVNLNDPESSPFSPLPFIGGHGEGVDVIFCQNVLIYFKMEDRLAIVHKLCKRLRLGGYLFLGPSEAIGLELSDMIPIRLGDMLIYQRQ